MESTNAMVHKCCILVYAMLNPVLYSLQAFIPCQVQTHATGFQRSFWLSSAALCVESHDAIAHNIVPWQDKCVM